MHIMDWETKSAGHPEYFFADGIHLTEAGRVVYTKFIYDQLYDYYLNELNNQREEALKERDDNNKRKIAFYGNSVLLNAFESIEKNYQNAIFNVNKDYTSISLTDDIKEKVSNDTLENRVVLLIDKSTNMTKSDYKKIIDLCKSSQLYIIMFDDTVELEESEKVKVLKFYDEIKDNDDYLMIDKIHLSNKGNQALVQFLIDNIN